MHEWARITMITRKIVVGTLEIQQSLLSLLLLLLPWKKWARKPAVIVYILMTFAGVIGDAPFAILVYTQSQDSTKSAGSSSRIWILKEYIQHPPPRDDLLQFVENLGVEG
ncbi:MAG: hypothetical protein C5B49_13030 [Bdellovibrio sp.]|nr:MAG: hypothetical protein C5B49_13030 [Bdellovibrio sp.]